MGAMLPRMIEKAAAPAACPECGKAIVAGAAFCAFCGSQVSA